MSNASEVLKTIKDNDIKYVDLRFTDPRGKMQHVTMDVSSIDEDAFADGIMFDGSSIAGWKAINESDMTLMPDPGGGGDRSVLRAADARDLLRHPRSRHRRALQPRPAHHRQEGARLSAVDSASATPPISARRPSSSSSTTCASRPTPYNTGFEINSSEFPTNSDIEYEGGNLGHRSRTKGGYFPVPPIDSAQDLRSDMLMYMAQMGVPVEKHHHEVGVRPARARHQVPRR